MSYLNEVQVMSNTISLSFGSCSLTAVHDIPSSGRSCWIRHSSFVSMSFATPRSNKTIGTTSLYALDKLFGSEANGEYRTYIRLPINDMRHYAWRWRCLWTDDEWQQALVWLKPYVHIPCKQITLVHTWKTMKSVRNTIHVTVLRTRCFVKSTRASTSERLRTNNAHVNHQQLPALANCLFFGISKLSGCGEAWHCAIVPLKRRYSGPNASLNSGLWLVHVKGLVHVWVRVCMQGWMSLPVQLVLAFQQEHKDGHRICYHI